MPEEDEVKVLILDQNEKETLLNCLVFVSQGMSVDKVEEFNHLAGIHKKIKETMD